MRTRTITVREGEYLGPIDWDYDFRSHYDNYCSSDEQRDKACEAAIEMLKNLCDGNLWQATTDGGAPKFGWGEVLSVGMYDGWPYWRPVPSVCISGVFGAEWHSFKAISGHRRVEDAKDTD